jgi:hypothetical protein
MSENKPNNGHLTVYDATYNLLRKLELTTMFGNPGSTEQPFLKNFPRDFQYVLGLQEASAVAMADGFAQATRKPVLVNLHTSAGTGNGMGNIMTAYQNKTPLIESAVGRVTFRRAAAACSQAGAGHAPPARRHRPSPRGSPRSMAARECPCPPARRPAHSRSAPRSPPGP